MKALQFRPYLKQTIWGGDRIIPFKHLSSGLRHVGESWEVSGVPGHESVAQGGEYDGRHLGELVAQLKDKLVGKANYERFGDEFPLLIKFIDASEPLSIQVHPDDAKAQELGYERGKTEMWYLMKSDPGASMLVGLKKEITPEQYKAMVEDDTITTALARYEVGEGDCFFLPAGRIHSIGKGCFLCEIQQTSDVTFRIYDFKRKDGEGNYRQLHTREAALSIDYRVEPNYRTNYVKEKNRGVQLVSCPYFKTLVYDIDKAVAIDLSSLDSFLITIVAEGAGSLADDEGNTYNVKAGDTLLFPATTRQVKAEGQLKLVATYV